MVKKFTNSCAVNAVGRVLQSVNLHAALQYLLELGPSPQSADGFFYFDSALDDNIGQLFSPLGRAGYFIDKHRICRSMDEIYNIIHRMRQQSDILPVERRDERAGQHRYNLVGDGVALVLQLGYLRHPAIDKLHRAHHLLQRLRPFDDIFRAFLEEVKELLLPGHKGKSRHSSSFALDALKLTCRRY